MLLADATVGRRVRIARVDLDGEAASWIGAVGLHDGEELVVLRRAALGGPLHVRIGTTEVIMRRCDARSIQVQPH